MDVVLSKGNPRFTPREKRKRMHPVTSAARMVPRIMRIIFLDVGSRISPGRSTRDTTNGRHVAVATGLAALVSAIVAIMAFSPGDSVIGVAVEHLFAGELGHGVNEFSVEEALLARIGLLGALLELIDGFRGGDRVVDG